MKNILIMAAVMLFATVNVSNATDINQNELRCLARNIYHEARGEGIRGQRAVAFVTLNRVADKNFPNSICGVVWQSKQFSWTFDKKSDVMKDKNAKKIAERIATNVLLGVVKDDPTNGALFFHTTGSRPSWSKKFERTARIGNHIFYTF